MRAMNATFQSTVSYAQLISSGLSPSEIQSSIKKGHIIRLRHGVYRPGGTLDPVMEHRHLIHCTAPLVSDASVFAHVSAAILHELPVPNEALTRCHMIRSTEGHGNSSRRLLVRKMRLAQDEVETIDGFRVTSLARTAADLARTLPFVWGVAACDAALRQGLEPAELWHAVTRYERLRGAPRARAVAEFADPRSESPAESISRAQFLRHGIPAPELQFEVINDLGVVVARSDFAWPELGLVGEVDGRSKYGALLTPGQTADAAIMNEKRREEEIRLAGYWLVRWDWNLCLHGADLAQRIRRAAEAQRRPSGVSLSR